MEGDNLQVNSNPIKDCELVAAPSSHVVQWLEYVGSMWAVQARDHEFDSISLYLNHILFIRAAVSK